MCISTYGERVPNILPTSLVKRACMNCSTHKAIPLTFSCEVATGTGVPVKGQTVVRYRVNNEYRELTSDTH